MTPSQELALEQLHRIAENGDALEIIEVLEPTEKLSSVRVVVSLYCKDMPRVPAGLPIRDRERVTIWIGEGFPYAIPSVSVEHDRFAGFPHVNWSRLLCLYQAPQTEWSPEGGMAGFLARLELWFRKAAADALDPVGGALHPPVTYDTSGPLLIPRRNAPVSGNRGWLGFAELEAISENRLDLVEWKEADGEPTEGRIAAAAILLDRPMPLEYPEKLGTLLACLENRGVPIDSLLTVIRDSVHRNIGDHPLYIILGTPMRGTRGGELRQHLACWQMDAFAGEIAELKEQFEELERGFRTLRMEADAQKMVDHAGRVRAIFLEWAKDRQLTWCQVREDRPEVTVRRDTGRPAATFAGKAVEVWGCGALGSPIAEWVVRAGAARVVVRDESRVTPGILVRQPYGDADIGRPKATVLAERLKAIRPDCDVTGIHGNVLHGPLKDGKLTDVADLIIDATASNIVLTKTEEVWRHNSESRCDIASVVIDGQAERLLTVVVKKEHTGGPFDVVRRVKLTACNDPRMGAYLDAFFPKQAAVPFQPEPGCSDATFVGSAADAALLAAIATNHIAGALANGRGTANGCFAAAPRSQDASTQMFVTEFQNDLVFRDPQTGYETRMEPSVWRTLQSWKNESLRRRGEDVETGGLLFGEMSEHLGVVWVSEASGPPADSRHSREEFVCGIEGTAELNEEKQKRSRLSVQYVGTWHTHPVSAPVPSARDFGAMAELLTAAVTPVERLLLFIVGKMPDGPAVTATVFLRKEFEALRRNGFMQRSVAVNETTADSLPERPRVGVALSGGGSRAMAFHMGCLRAIHDRGLLDQVEVLSTVSGGSVIGAMYAYSNDTFDEFESRVHAILRKGLVFGLARRTFLSPRLLAIFGTKVTSGLVANLTFVSRFVLGSIESLLPRDSKARGLVSQRLQPPFRRWVTRTQAFEHTLRDLLFGKTTVGTERRNGMDIVLNACELRTGTAFRFGSKESGSWRFGVIDGNDVEVAAAVAASAAYPALLPAIDRYFDFVDRKGERRRSRVILTDGGVYENLGVSCMTPDRSGAFSTNVFRPPYIICCDAGPGQFDDVVMPYGWTTRMRRSFEATFRQTQHGLQRQLHMWKQYGAIDGFVYAYLGQQDSRLPVLPSDLVRRDEVVNYPTDFSPMSETDIKLLSRRGEQLTRFLIEYYCPTL